VIQLARVLCHLLLVGSAFAFSASDCFTDSGEHAEPLLAPNVHSAGKAYGSISTSDGDDDDDDDGGSDDEDEPERIKDLKKKQQQRLADRGSWLAYLKDFRVLLPLIWPSDNRFVLGCSTLLIGVLLADRALNVLVPR
jgi:hypothetical protein